MRGQERIRKGMINRNMSREERKTAGEWEESHLFCLESDQSLARS